MSPTNVHSIPRPRYAHSSNFPQRLTLTRPSSAQYHLCNESLREDGPAGRLHALHAPEAVVEEPARLHGALFHRRTGVGPHRYRDRRTPLSEDCRRLHALLGTQRRRVHRQRPHGPGRGPAASEETPSPHRLRQAADPRGESRSRSHWCARPDGLLPSRTAIRAHHVGLSRDHVALHVRPEEDRPYRRVLDQRRIHTPGRCRSGRHRLTHILLALHLHRSCGGIRCALKATKRACRRGRSGPRSARHPGCLHPSRSSTSSSPWPRPLPSCPTPSTP